MPQDNVATSPRLTIDLFKKKIWNMIDDLTLVQTVVCKTIRIEMRKFVTI